MASKRGSRVLGDHLERGSKVSRTEEDHRIKDPTSLLDPSRSLGIKPDGEKSNRPGNLFIKDPPMSEQHEKLVEKVVGELFDEIITIRETAIKKGIIKNQMNPEKTRQAILVHARKNGVLFDRNSILKMRDERRERDRLKKIEENEP